MKHIRLYIVTLSLLFGLGSIVVPAVAMAASPQSTVCSTLGSSSNCSSTPSDGVSLNNVVAAVINILSLIVGIASVIMIIVGGFRYVTSGGDSNSTTSAKNTIIYAIVGLCVVVLAQAIVRFVLTKIT